MTSRHERLNERMRGAQRHQVEDVSFGFDFNIAASSIEQQPNKLSVTNTVSEHMSFPLLPAPNTSAKRRRLDHEGGNAGSGSGALMPLLPQALSPPAELPTVHRPRIKPDGHHVPEHITQRPVASTTRTGGLNEGAASAVAAAASSSRAESLVLTASGSRSLALAKATNILDDHAGASSASKSLLAKSSHATVVLRVADEKDIQMKGVSQVNEMNDGDLAVVEDVASSSPLPRRAMRTENSGLKQSENLAFSIANSTPEGSSRISTGLSRRLRKSASLTVDDELHQVADKEKTDRLSPSSQQDQNAGPTFLCRQSRSADVEDDNFADQSEHEGGPTGREYEVDDGRKIDNQKAAERQGRKRSRRCLLDQRPVEDVHQPRAKHPRGRRSHGPTRQQQLKAKRATPANAFGRRQASKRVAVETVEKETGKIINITVQRYKKPGQAQGAKEHDSIDNTPNCTFPYAEAKGVHVVDVLWQLLAVIKDKLASSLEKQGRAAENVASRREARAMTRALEVFSEGLNARLLEQVTALDEYETMRKRLRDAQRARVKLREEILRARKERDEAAVRMDAVRANHEARIRLALQNTSLSSAMHDIDLAIERAQGAFLLPVPEQRCAKVTDLELLMTRVADLACSGGDARRGVLCRFKEFNAFLERAAVALEST